jgi:hypothetical protein
MADSKNNPEKRAQHKSNRQILLGECEHVVIRVKIVPVQGKSRMAWLCQEGCGIVAKLLDKSVRQAHINSELPAAD